MGGENKKYHACVCPECDKEYFLTYDELFLGKHDLKCSICGHELHNIKDVAYSYKK